MPIRKDQKCQTFLLSLDLQSMHFVSINIFHAFQNRNKIFIKFPGRDLGGVFAFLKGFRNETWVALILLVFSLPTCLFLVYLVLTYFEIHETEKWSLFHNFLVYVAAIAQQVYISFNH